MPFADLRGYIDKIEDLGVLKRIDGADWDLEIGALSDLYRRRKSTLFDNIKGYAKGYRVLSNIFATEVANLHRLPMSPSPGHYFPGKVAAPQKCAFGYYAELH